MKKIFAILASARSDISLTTTGLLVLFFPYFSLAQIVIEERVEIEPTNQQIISDNPTFSQTLQLDVQWNQPQYDAAIAGVVVPCQNSGADWQSGGIISLIIENAMAGFYRLQPRFNTPTGVTTHVTYQLYLNGTQVLSGQRDVPGGFSGGSFPGFNIDYTPPLASSFGLNLQNNTSCMLIPTPIEISASASCATGYSWYRNTEPLNLIFTSGGEYASFYTNGQKIGDSYSGTLSEIQHINVIQDKVYRESADMYYVVQGDWAGVIKTDSVRIISQIGDVIVADTEGEDSIYSGQQIQVMIYPNDFGGQCSGIFFPYEVTYNVEIISGNQFGNLIDYFPERRVQILTGLSHWYGMSAFNYIADGISADSLETVTIRVSTSDPEIPYTDLTLYIKPSPIYAYTIPEVLGADDTADVIIKKRNPDGTLVDFPSDQTFELAVLDGCVNGNFMVGDSINVYFADAMQPIKFVTADSLDGEVDSVLIRVGTDLSGYSGYNRPVGGVSSAEEEQKRTEYESKIIGATGKTLKELREGFEQMIAEKKAEAEKKEEGGNEPLAPVVTECALGDPTYPYNTKVFVNTEEETIEILLGETKYFQAKYNAQESKLKIEEIIPDANGVPQQKTGTENGWEWLTEDKWGTDPILPVIENSVSAVYWEKRYPIYDEINDYDGSEDIDDGLIRVMGRFWREKESGENETEYKNKHSVNLTVKFANDINKSIVLTVIKPNKLGTTHNQEKDVFGNFYNLDEEIFYYAGKYGIPPQFIKADIEAEGNFNPAYRYEPFYTIKMLYKVDENGEFGQVHDLLISSLYRITVDGKIYLDASNINGTANIGPVDGLEDHVYITNGVVTGGLPVTIDGYPGYTGSIWDDFYAKCKTVNPDALYDIYPKKEPQWSDDAIKGWDDKYKEIIKNWEGKIGTNITIGGIIIEITEELVKLGARLYANEWLKTEYRGGIFQKGIAQTRLAASYGVMQIIYPSAKSFQNYTGKPELLNEYDINFSNAIPFLKKKVRLTLNLTETDFNKKNNFSSGIEEVYVSGFNKYHNSEKVEYCGNKYTYGRCVLSKNKKYNPIK